MNKLNNHSFEARLKALEKDVMEIKMLLKERESESSIASKNDNEILNANEAMKILGIPRHILYAKTTSGEIPGFKIGKLYKYERSKLLEWQQAQRLDVDVDGLVERYMQQHILKG